MPNTSSLRAHGFDIALLHGRAGHDQLAPGAARHLPRAPFAADRRLRHADCALDVAVADIKPRGAPAVKGGEDCRGPARGHGAEPWMVSRLPRGVMSTPSFCSIRARCSSCSPATSASNRLSSKARVTMSAISAAQRPARGWSIGRSTAIQRSLHRRINHAASAIMARKAVRVQHPLYGHG